MTIEPLSEEDFIQESYPRDPLPMWMWLAVLMLFVVLLWGGNHWYRGYVREKVEASRFMQVTNRDLSRFLWQFPQHMRSNQRSKASYLPGFDKEEGAKLEEGAADKFVMVAPEVLFHFHHWDRLIGRVPLVEQVERSIVEDFLRELPEWHPDNWLEAPASFREELGFVDVASQFSGGA